MKHLFSYFYFVKGALVSVIFVLSFFLTPSLLELTVNAGPYTVPCSSNPSICTVNNNPCGACGAGSAWCDSNGTCSFTCYSSGNCAGVCTSWEGWTPSPCSTGEYQTNRCNDGLHDEIYQIRLCASTSNPGGGPGCSVGGWVDEGCGGGGCAATEMYQTRVVNPAGCNGNSSTNCSANPVCTGAPPSNFSFDINNAVLNGVGDTTTELVYNINPPSTTIVSVSFQVVNSGVASVTSVTPDLGAPFSVTLKSNSIGTSTYIATAVSDTGVISQNQKTVTVVNPAGWGQGGSGDIIAGSGNISASIPAVCTDPVNCVLITGTASLNPGIAQAGGNSISPGSGEISQPDPPYNWAVTNSPYNGTNFNYAFFDARTQSKSFAIPPNSTLSNGTADVAGYKWLKSNGDFTIPGDINLTTNKVVLLVNGDLNIHGKINLTDGRGFFMAIVNGDINIKGSVGGAADGISPEIEGLYFANDIFHSAVIVDPLVDSAPHQQLHVKGTIVANAFDLTRSLADNSATPGEYFEFSPALLLQIPASLGRRQVIWREVAP